MFYVAVDTVLRSVKHLFEKNQPKKYAYMTVSNSDEDNQEKDDGDNDKFSSTQFSRDGSDDGVTAVMTTKMKLRRSGKSHSSLNLSQFFVTLIIVWLMRTQHLVKLTPLLWPSQLELRP